MMNGQEMLQGLCLVNMNGETSANEVLIHFKCSFQGVSVLVAQ